MTPAQIAPINPKARTRRSSDSAWPIKRNGEPAYVSAPPRLRASQIQRPTQPLAESKPRWWQWGRKG